MDATTLKSRMLRCLVLLLGLLLPQFLLYGPSLLGQKFLLPLDILCQDRIYIPRAADAPPTFPHNSVLSDLVLLNVHDFAAREIRAGRYPLWNPNIFAGAPFAGYAKLSPFNALYYCFPTPVTLAWMQVFVTLVAGVGAYLFFRKTMHVNFLPAAIGAWCFPLTGFFVQWQGYGLAYPIAILPWVLLAIYLSTHGKAIWGIVLLALFSGLMLVAGALDVALLAMLGCGFYALWCLWDQHGVRIYRAPGLKAVGALTIGFALGLALATPHILPLYEYTRTGDRFMRRAAGEEERPPVGLEALPQVILPNMYGSTQKGSIRMVPGNQLESSAAGYAGLVATLLLAPLAFSNRKRLSANLFWTGVAGLSLCWVLNVPGIVTVMRLPGFNTFSYNRFTFLFSFSVLTLSVTSLQLLSAGELVGRRWRMVPAILVLGLGIWCAYCVVTPPAVIVAQLRAAGPTASLWGLTIRAAGSQILYFFAFYYALAAVLCGLAFAVWAMLSTQRPLPHWAMAAAALVLVGDLVIYAWDTRPQCDPALYYPKLEVLEKLANSPTHDRILGFMCLPPDVGMNVGLRDIRGYDAVDPKLLMDLLDLARAPASGSPMYARSQWYAPQLKTTGEGEVFLPPVLSMLNVRYLILRGTAQPGLQTFAAGQDYLVIENRAAVPRIFVPRTVSVVADDATILQRLASPYFEPGAVAFTEVSPGTLPERCEGTVTIVHDVPCEVRADVAMKTPGMVVLGDLWDQGWKANLDGQTVPILKVNHAVRGVVVSEGNHTLTFRYEPESFRRGAILACIALGICGLLTILQCFLGRRGKVRNLASVSATA